MKDASSSSVSSDISGEAPRKSNRITRRLIVLVCLIALITFAIPGCMGIAVGTFGTSRGEVSNPYASVDWEGRKVISDWNRPEQMASAQLLEKWGEPDSRSESPEGIELWNYNAGLRWAGAYLLVVIIPLPLGVPVGRNHVTFLIQDELVVGARSSDTALGFSCGIYWATSSFHGGGFHAECGGEIADSFRNPFE